MIGSSVLLMSTIDKSVGKFANPDKSSEVSPIATSMPIMDVLVGSVFTVTLLVSVMLFCSHCSSRLLPKNPACAVPAHVSPIRLIAIIDFFNIVRFSASSKRNSL